MGKAQAGRGGVDGGWREGCAGSSPSFLPPCHSAALPLCRPATLPPCHSAALPLCRPAQRHRAATRSVRVSVLFDLFNVCIWGDAGGSGRGTPALSWFLFQIQKVI